MTRREAIETEAMLTRLQQLGISRADAESLRRISMTLHRWHEMECGTDGGCIERDELTGKTYWLNSMTGRRSPINDREAGAKRRLAKIIERFNASKPDGGNLVPYVQGGPRGCALYIVRVADIPGGVDLDSCYSRGVAVFK